MLNICLVGDNRSSWNWGGRAAGIALHDLLSKRFEVSSTLTGLEGAGPPHYPRTLAPANLFRMAFDRRKTQPFRSWIRLEEAFGARDYVCADPEMTAQSILRARDTSPLIKSIYDRLANCDAVVVNGEGDLVFTTPPRRIALFLLGLCALALRMGKPVIVANSMVADCPTTGRNQQTFEAAARLFRQCKAVFVRDDKSLECVRQGMPGVTSAMIPDSLFAWHDFAGDSAADLPAHGDCVIPFPEFEKPLGRLDFRQPYICVGGGAASALDPDRAVAAYARLVEGLRPLGLDVILTENDGPDQYLRMVAKATGVGLVPVGTSVYMGTAILANAKLFVSGRYHPSIMAMMGGTPCIFLSTTAHKMESLQGVLGMEKPLTFPSIPGAADVAAIVGHAKDLLVAGDALRQRIRAAAGIRAAEVATLPDEVARALAPLA